MPRAHASRVGNQHDRESHERSTPTSPVWRVAQGLEALAERSPVVQRLRRVEQVANDSPTVVQARRYDELANNDRTQLPAGLRSGLEQLSGLDLSPVRVHYDSPEPARLDALAITRGRDIHLGPGQEEHLPHESWHAVQQMRGTVEPTASVGGVAINDSPVLEREADVMGARAQQVGAAFARRPDAAPQHAATPPVQRAQSQVVQLMTSEERDEYFGGAMNLLRSHEPSVDAQADFLTSLYATHYFDAAIENENVLEAIKAAAAVPGGEILVAADKPGNDKQWFPHPSLPIGWLQARDDSKVAAVLREVAAIRALAGHGVPVAKIISRPAPAECWIGQIGQAGRQVQVFSPGGVWLEQVDISVQKKPKVLGNPMELFGSSPGKAATKKLVEELQGKQINLNNVAQNLAALLPLVDTLCGYAGEVDLTFSADGSIRVLDVAPADGGQVANQEAGGVDTIKKGIRRIIQLIGGQELE